MKDKRNNKMLLFSSILKYNKILSTQVLLYIESAIGLDQRVIFKRLIITDE